MALMHMHAMQILLLNPHSLIVDHPDLLRSRSSYRMNSNPNVIYLLFFLDALKQSANECNSKFMTQ